MPDSQPCLDARASLEEIRSLRSEFESAYAGAATFGNPGEAERAAGLREAIEGKVLALRETVAIHETDRMFDLRRQYDAQTSLLRRARLVEAAIEKDDSGVERETLFMTGIDGERYTLPSYEAVALRMVERRDLLGIKADQGFTKLLIVPFGMKLKELFGKFRAYLIEYEKSSGLSHLDMAELPWDDQTSDDDPARAATAIYDVALAPFGRTHGGRLKSEILDRQEKNENSAVAWRVLLLQAGADGKGFREIPRTGDGTSMGTGHPRPDIEAGKSPSDYHNEHLVAAAREDSPYRGESEMCLEEWLVLFIAHLEETGKYMNDVLESGCLEFLTGTYFPGVNGTPTVSVASGRLHLGRASFHTFTSPARGARFVVRV